MKTFMIVLVGMVSLATPAFAEYDTDDVAKDVARVKSDEAFTDVGVYPTKHPQIIVIKLDRVGLRSYTIDLRAKLCYFSVGSGSTSVVPCANVKAGYPLIAPLITW